MVPFHAIIYHRGVLLERLMFLCRQLIYILFTRRAGIVAISEMDIHAMDTALKYQRDIKE